MPISRPSMTTEWVAAIFCCRASKTARTAGKVREIRVKEGQAVKAKELLMLLD